MPKLKDLEGWPYNKKAPMTKYIGNLEVELDVEKFKEFYIEREFPSKEQSVYIPHECYRWLDKFARVLSQAQGMIKIKQ